MKKKILKIVVLLFAAALILVLCVFANGFFGNPISKALAKNAAEKHLEEAYANHDYKIDSVSFSFKDGSYHAFIYSPSSIDSNFTIFINMWGRIQYDSYEDRVLSGWNTADRISTEYRAAVDEILNSKDFPYHEYIGYGEFEFYPKVHLEQFPVPEYALICEDLKFDGLYDVKTLGASHGKLTIYIEDAAVSAENLSKILLDIRKIFDDAEVSFYVMDCVLESFDREERVEVREFFYADIDLAGMVERVEASNEAAKAYYAEQDAKNLKEAEVK
jgi:hypothetical protein